MKVKYFSKLTLLSVSGDLKEIVDDRASFSRRVLSLVASNFAKFNSINLSYFSTQFLTPLL